MEWCLKELKIEKVITKLANGEGGKVTDPVVMNSDFKDFCSKLCSSVISGEHSHQNFLMFLDRFQITIIEERERGLE